MSQMFYSKINYFHSGNSRFCNFYQTFKHSQIKKTKKKCDAKLYLFQYTNFYFQVGPLCRRNCLPELTRVTTKLEVSTLWNINPETNAIYSHDILCTFVCVINNIAYSWTTGRQKSIYTGKNIVILPEN